MLEVKRNMFLALALATALFMPVLPALASQAPLTLTDQAGREVRIFGEPQRIVSGYYISSSACVALGLADRLVGMEAKADSRPLYRLAAPRLLGLPHVGSAKEFDLEGCAALEPDLVILPKRLADAADTLAELGIPVLLVSPESHGELVEMIALLGAATGTRQPAKALTDYYARELADIEGITQGLEGRPVVYMGANSSYLATAPRDMYQASLIEAAGGVNAGAEIDGNSWTEVSYEQLLALNPEVLVIPAEAGYTKEDIFADAQLADVEAVRQKRVYQMPKDFEAWDSPVPSCVLGFRWLLSVLHGDAYPMEAMRAEAQAFYRAFYGAEIDTALIGK